MMLEPKDYSFTRYLSAKKSVDDRSLNGFVWQEMAWIVDSLQLNSQPRILEVGAGIGTMLERLLERGVLTQAHYTAIDSEAENITCALERFPGWATDQGYQILGREPHFYLLIQDQQVEVAFQFAEVYEFARQQQGKQAWDVLVAHAFLDLLDIDRAIPELFSLLKPGGWFYFTLNYDGLTSLEPAIDPELDDRIVTLYHHTMDERITAGLPSGDSRTGRHLFQALRRGGGQILATGASDWVVAAGPQGYAADEAYFLHFILHTIDQALRGHPALDADRFASWVAARHTQVENGELVYIAHQIDFWGKIK